MTSSVIQGIRTVKPDAGGNQRPKLLSIFGTRPEAIKLAPVIHALQGDPFFDSRVVVTGQHREMLDQVLKVFSIQPHHDLCVMAPNQTLPQLTGRILDKLDPIFAREKPDCILVQGDTTTVFASSYLAYCHKIPVAHLEAGLRTLDKYSPFPEEVNRRLTAVLADIHFCPTKRSRENLLREGIDPALVHVTQNTVIDALLYTTAQNLPRPKSLQGVDFNKRILTVTMHRRENQGHPIKAICNALRKVVGMFPDVEIVFPVHLSPAVRQTVWPILEKNERIHLVEPLDYVEFSYLLKESFLILTDSGGIQEEAPSLGKPVIVLRETTERPEGVEAGVSFLAGTNPQRIIELCSSFLSDDKLYQRTAQIANPYGDGHASERIVLLLKNFLLQKKSGVKQSASEPIEQEQMP